jgi:UPF0755 protein
MTEVDLEPPRTEPARPRRRWGPLALLLSLLLIAGAATAGAVGYYSWCKGASGPSRPVSIQVPAGATGDDVVGILAEKQVIRCGGFIGESLLRRTGKAEVIRAGSYDLSTNMGLDEALRVLTRPPKAVPISTLTIPEGYRLTQIAEAAHDQLGVSADRVLQLAEGGGVTLPPYLTKKAETSEGFLFPETYEFVDSEVSPKNVVRRLLHQFGDQVARLPWENAEKLGLSPYEVVIVASLIEREAVIPEERPRIAAVIYNRIDLGEILGIDAALQYIDPDPSDGLTESDLAIDSPYNTRLNKGLPPTPIASPGLSSLQAALEPLATDDRYYVLCGDDGRHEFSADYDQFLADKERCLG